MKAKTAFQSGDLVRIKKIGRQATVVDVLPSGRVLLSRRVGGVLEERLEWPKGLDLLRRRPRKDVAGVTVARGFGFVGRWHGGALGWQLPPFINGSTNMPHADNLYVWGSPGKRRDAGLVLCEITVRQVFDKRGREIVMNHHPSNRNEKP